MCEPTLEGYPIPRFTKVATSRRHIVVPDTTVANISSFSFKYLQLESDQRQGYHLYDRSCSNWSIDKDIPISSPHENGDHDTIDAKGGK